MACEDVSEAALLALEERARSLVAASFGASGCGAAPRTSAVTVSRAARSLFRQHALADVDGAAAVVADPASGALAALVGLALRCGAEMTWRSGRFANEEGNRRGLALRWRESPRTVRRRSESHHDRALQ